MAGSTKDPSYIVKGGYAGFWPSDRTTYHFETREDAEVRHVIFGHSQLRDKWKVKVDLDVDIDIDWISFSGGKARFLAGEIIKLLKSSDIPLRISAVIWQNSMGECTNDDLFANVLRIEEVLKRYPQHKVAFPTCPFMPELNDCFEKVGNFNNMLRDYQIHHNMGPYNLHKSLMRKKKGKGMLVSQEAFKEFRDGKGKGYHIDKSYEHKYVKFIKNYHLHGFMDSKSARRIPAPNDTVRHLFPEQRMYHPVEVDVRQRLNNIRSRKRDQYGNVVVQDEIHRLGLVERAEVRRAAERVDEVKSYAEEADVDLSVYRNLRRTVKEKQKQVEIEDRDLEARTTELQYRSAEVALKEAETRDKDIGLEIAIAQKEKKLKDLQKSIEKLRKEKEEMRKK